MKRKPRKRSPRMKVLHLWTHAQATQALPYFRSVLGSVREHWLDLQRAKQRVRRLDRQPGRRDRKQLLERQSATEESDRAGDRFEDAVRELMAVDVFCTDPVGGQALIPFREKDELAWFVFDLFDPKGVDGWRFHHDPLEMRRPLTEATPKAGIQG